MPKGARVRRSLLLRRRFNGFRQDCKQITGRRPSYPAVGIEVKRLRRHSGGAPCFKPLVSCLPVGGLLTALGHPATRLVGRTETGIPEAAELIRSQRTKLSLKFPTTIERQALETPIGVLNPVTRVRR